MVHIFNTNAEPALSLCRKPTSKPRVTAYVFLLTLMACIGGLLFGYDTGIVSSVMLYLPNNKGMGHLSTLWQELVISITPGMAGISALLAGKTSDRYGRRAVILLASSIFVFGAILCGVALDRWMLFFGRVFLGFAIGFASMVIPVFIGEGAPSHMRGMLVTIYQFMIAFGFVVANALAAWFAHYDPENLGWRLMFSFAAVPAVIQFVGFLFLPETPRFLANHGRQEAAREVLNKVYGGHGEWIAYEMEEITRNMQEELKYRKTAGSSSIIGRVLQTAHVRKALLLGCAMQMFQQFAGINTILYYTGTIIRSAGVKDKITTIWISCGVSAVQAVGTFPPMKLIEKLGRRVILIGSMIGVIVSLCLMGGAFLLISLESQKIDTTHAFDGISLASVNDTNLKKCAFYTTCDSCVTSDLCGYCSTQNISTQGQCLPIDPDNRDHSTVGYCKRNSDIEGFSFGDSYCATRFTALPIIVMIIYLLCFAFGLGAMPWVFNAEIYPLWARSTCVSLSTFTNWVFNLLVSLTFLSLSQSITKYGAFFLYALISTIGVIIFYLFVPETRGCQIEEVELLFMTAAERERRRAAASDEKDMEMTKCEPSFPAA